MVWVDLYAHEACNLWKIYYKHDMDHHYVMAIAKDSHDVSLPKEYIC